jgi:hypothetical protein
MRADSDIMGSMILFEFIKNIMLELRKVNNNNCETLRHTKYNPNLRSDRFFDEIF